MSAPVYLDYNATAPLKPAVIAAVSAALAETGNASSVHRFGRLARRTVECARERVAALVNAPAASIVFTSGGTEANNLAVGHARAEGRRVIVSAIEHESVLRAAPEAALAPVDANGVVDLGALERLLANAEPALVAVMLANNETGVIQPVAEIVRLARAHGALVHCDAAQAAGKIAVDVQALGADTLALSAHKLGGPQGLGALFVSDRIALRAQLVGGGQERGRRAGTENVAGIAGFGVAASLATADLAQMAEIARLRDAAEARLRNIAPGTVVFGANADRLPNTICVAMPGVAAETQVMALDLAGVAVSAGSACSSGKVKASHVLAAMDVPPALAGSAVRISAGWRSTAEDFDHFVEAWTALWARLGAPRVGSVAPAA
ncbi:MAG TPA: cysteine desulfurase family protein [Alphaproteobacteria bacterium]|nr:cysteine desulfurase family protein [Alphaproteobacteria bacterium]